MFKRLSAITTLLFLVFIVAAQEHIASSWIKIAPTNGGFTAMMPSKPEEQITTKEQVTTYAYIAKLDRGVYLAAYSDYASSIKVDPQVELEADRDNFIKVLDAKLLTSRNITIDGRQGIEFTSETPAANIKSKVFIRGNRVFQQAVLISKDTDQTKAVETFFDSFAFTTKN
jgi:uncharacterized protein with FMN-binding domain